MDKAGATRPIAWQPLTPGGVGAFARATYGRILIIQAIFGLIGGASVGWVLDRTWFPVIDKAIAAAPAGSQVQWGRLRWTGDLPRQLAENRFVGVGVDLKHEGLARGPSDIQIELGETSVKVISWLGFVESSYPTGWRVGLSREEAMPWWRARAPWLLALSIMGSAALLIISWHMLGTAYFFPGWLLGFFLNRELSLGGSWRVSMAALMPGGAFFAGAIVLYGLGVVDVPRLGVLCGVHIVIGWVYLVAAVWKTPRQAATVVEKGNPFSGTANTKDRRTS